MQFDPDIHKRKSIRLKGYNYSQNGLYFVTICTNDKECYFGEITVGAIPCGCPPNVPNSSTDDSGCHSKPINDNPAIMKLNDAGKMIESEWLALPKRFPNIVLHEYVIMPNHFHAILEINCEKGQPQGIAPTRKSIGDMMDAFKSITTIEYIRGVKTLGWKSFNNKIWQRNYYEHIIRNKESYQKISDYIINNPAKWQEDDYNINKNENEIQSKP